MNEQVRKISLVLTLFLIIIIAGFSAKIIGDKIIDYRSYESVRPISLINRPLLSLIDELQAERVLSSKHLSKRTENSMQDLLKQFKKTNSAFEGLKTGLNLSGQVQKSLPSAGLDMKLKRLDISREEIKKRDQRFFQIFNTYNKLIEDLHIYQNQIFTYPSGEKFTNLLKGILDAGELKELLSKEQAFVAYHLNNYNKSGQIPIINQEMIFHSEYEKKLRSLENKQMAHQVDKIFSSDEYDKFMKIQQQLREKNSELLDLPERSEEYLRMTSGFVDKIRDLINTIQNTIDQFSEDGLIELRSNVLWTIISLSVALLILIGISVIIRRTTAKTEIE